MKLKVKKTNRHAIIPTKGTEHSVGWDLYVPKQSRVLDRYLGTLKYKQLKYHLHRRNVYTIKLGIAVEIPVGYWGEVVIRSSLGLEGVTLANSVGVIDSDYRGELAVMLVNNGALERIINPGERVAQLILHKVENFELEEVDELSDTKRGTGGFGSTGK